MDSLHSTVVWALSIAAMVLGFGFVIFWHELGHFLGARWAGIRVEQFAVGMGNAICSYRKGIGIRRGNTMAEFDRRVDEEFARREREGLRFKERTAEPTLRERYEIAHDLGMGETEYRLSWLPIGGYVKPTGQDDMRPAALASNDDPKSYAAAPVGKRMVMIAAGVIMNVILAAILFFILFRFIGFNSTQPIVGQVQSNSPAAEVGLRGGDELLELNGHTMHDFTKVLMNTPLLSADERSPLVFRRDGVLHTVDIQPRKTDDNSGMLAMGVAPAMSLRAVDEAKLEEPLTDDDRADLIVKPGETVTAVNGQSVGETDGVVLDRAVENYDGKPIELTLLDRAKKTTRTVTFSPIFAPVFDRHALLLMGSCPRAVIKEVQDNSSAKGKLKPNDIVLSMKRSSEEKPFALPTVQKFVETTRDAGSAGDTLDFLILRDGQEIAVNGVPATTSIGKHKLGLGVALDHDTDHVVAVGGDGRIEPGTTITSIAGQPVKTWFDVRHVLAQSNDLHPGKIDLGVITPDGKATTQSFALAQSDIDEAQAVRYSTPSNLAIFDVWSKERKTDNALTAIGWGAGETRDLILQTYLTIRRVVGGSVPASNMSGFVGIFHAGVKSAQRGPDWFVWFLAVVSANLAVVNFLPVPILDGWHFLSLVKEKITGRPLSERVQEVAQYVGLAMILSLIVFVTYNDIARMF